VKSLEGRAVAPGDVRGRRGGVVWGVLNAKTKVRLWLKIICLAGSGLFRVGLQGPSGALLAQENLSVSAPTWGY
jgi:hypothetical protein